MKIFALLVLSIMLAVVSACDSQPSLPTGAPVATLDPDWERFTAFDKTYSFAHPHNWIFDAVPGQTILFNLPDSAGFATVLLDSPLLQDRAAVGQSLQKRLSDQAARNGDQFRLITDGQWPQTTSDHYFVEHVTIEPSQQLSTYHVTFLIASSQQQTLFAQYFHLGVKELTDAERQMLRGILTSVQFAPR